MDKPIFINQVLSRLLGSLQNLESQGGTSIYELSPEEAGNSGKTAPRLSSKT
jgi:hypothetical protein